MPSDNFRPTVPVGMVLDYSDSGGDHTNRVRVKGFLSADKTRLKKSPGFVYLVPVDGDPKDEDLLPSELRDISVVKFWELVEEGRLQVIDSPHGS